MALLHVLLAAPADVPEADRLLRAVRRALPRTPDGRTVLLLCDLPAAPAMRMPEDEAVIRRLQSGVMSIENRRPGEALLLVRRRTWDPAMRHYAVPDQQADARRMLAQLLEGGETDTAFDAATFAPSSLKGRYDRILLCDVSLFCPPDTPLRMAALLASEPAACVSAPVLCMPQDEAPLLTHLINRGFSFTYGQEFPLHKPTMYTAHSLKKASRCVEAEDCAFACARMPDIHALLRDTHAFYLHSPAPTALLPALQVAVLLLSAVLGWPLAALAALILPEYRALRRPAKLPGALLRAALLPMHAAAALDALARRRFAGSRLYFTLPQAAMHPGVCVPFGLALLLCSLYGVHAAPQVFPLSLFWLFSPIIAQSVHLPGSERIPLSDDERTVLRTDAQSLLCSPIAGGHDPGLAMLCACANCMLGILEPDEAARRADGMQQSLAGWLKTKESTALSRAAVLACAQYLRERMDECDAALRALPGQLEALVHSAPPPRENSLLARLIRAGLQSSSAPLDEDGMRTDSAADSLFLPHMLLSPVASEACTLPLTHPHTYVKRRNLPAGHTHALPDSAKSSRAALHALCLVSSALDNPFRAYFLRSPIIAPVSAGLVFA